MEKDFRPSSLPYEVLNKIFSHLCLHDIKNVRQVCTDWYNASVRCNNLLTCEKLIFSDRNGIYPMDLLQCKRDFLHFTFERSLWCDNVFWARFGANLRSLCLIGCTIIPIQFLKVLKHCDLLECLTLEKCRFSDITRPNQRVCDNFPQLPRLESVEITHTTDSQLFDLVIQCAPNLKSVNLLNCWSNPEADGTPTGIGENMIAYMRAHDRQIQELIIRDEYRRDGEMVLKLVTMPNLRLRTLKIDEDGTNAVAIVTSQKGLRELEMSASVNDRLFDLICTELLHMEHLKLNCSRVSRGVESVFMLENLTTLHLRLSEKVQLKSLNLSGCRQITNTGFEGGVVEGLTVQENRLNPTGFGISRLTGLQVLTLSHCPNFTGTIFQSGLKFPDFRCLIMSFSMISVNSLEAFVDNNRTTEYIDLSKSNLENVTDELINGLVAKLPRLKNIILGLCPRVTNEGIKKLQSHCEVACICNGTRQRNP